MSLQSTPSQTVGPYYSLGLAPLYATELAGTGAKGHRITVAGVVYDGEDRPVGDAVLEVWQADADGIYNHPGDPRYQARDEAFGGWGRIPTDSQGRFRFTTIRPGRVPLEQTSQSPHLLVLVFMRGLLKAAPTRMYLPETAQGDPVLERVPRARRTTLVATADGTDHYRWDIRMQGEAETVFFDY